MSACRDYHDVPFPEGTQPNKAYYMNTDKIAAEEWTYNYNCGCWAIFCGDTHIGIAMTEKSAKDIVAAHKSAIEKAYRERTAIDPHRTNANRS